MCAPGNVCVKKFEAERLPKSHMLKRAVLKPSFISASGWGSCCLWIWHQCIPQCHEVWWNVVRTCASTFNWYPALSLHWWYSFCSFDGLSKGFECFWSTHMQCFVGPSTVQTPKACSQWSHFRTDHNHCHPAATLQMYNKITTNKQTRNIYIKEGKV